MSYYYSGGHRTGGGGRRLLAMAALVLVIALMGVVIWSAMDRRPAADDAPSAPHLEATPAPQVPQADPTALPEANMDRTPENEPSDPGLTHAQVFGSVADIVEASVDAVVNVINYQGAAQGGVLGFVPNEPAEDGTQERIAGFGSGVVISEDGYIITNNHVIEGATSLKVNMADGTSYDAQIVGSDAKTDIALLKIEAQGLKALVIGDSDALRMGDLAITIGYLEMGIPSSTAGIISTTEQQAIINNWPSTMLQIDAAINPGNSGGALINGKGELIGINTLKQNYVGYDNYGMLINADGIGFAIPSSEAKKVLDDLIQYGYVMRPTIGITGSEVNAQAAQFNDMVPGILISEVVAGSAAEAAGLHPEDIVTAIEGKEVKGIVDINRVLSEKKVGDTITLTVWRAGETADYQLTLGAPAEPVK